MAPQRQRNDRGDRARPDQRRAAESPEHAASSAHRRRLEDVKAEWLWGWHTVLAALDNPAREPAKRILATADRAHMLRDHPRAAKSLEIVEAAAIGQIVPQGAPHQGIALRIPLIEPTALDDLAADPRGFLVMLDQVTDPQNVGAIFRSAAAFGARGIILQDRHAPALAGALAKAAAGGIDKIPHAREVNLSRALEQLEQAGWRAVGLDGDAAESLENSLSGEPTVLVLGAEGEGLRRLVREHCDALASIPMPGGFESLNVSAAAAVAMYEVSRKR